MLVKIEMQNLLKNKSIRRYGYAKENLESVGRGR